MLSSEVSTFYQHLIKKGEESSMNTKAKGVMVRIFGILLTISLGVIAAVYALPVLLDLREGDLGIHTLYPLAVSILSAILVFLASRLTDALLIWLRTPLIQRWRIRRKKWSWWINPKRIIF